MSHVGGLAATASRLALSQMPAPSQNEQVDNLIGTRLRELRRARGLSAREVAKRASVTPAYLSRLENGHLSPTVSTLTRVVQAMGDSVASVFGSESAGPVVRKDERQLIRNRGVDDYLLSPTRNGRLEVLETVIEPGAGSGSDSYTHPGDEECILVLAGKLRVWLDDTEYAIDAGDSITFPCRVPHRWVNPTKRTTRVLWIITPAGY